MKDTPLFPLQEFCQNLQGLSHLDLLVVQAHYLGKITQQKVNRKKPSEYDRVRLEAVQLAIEVRARKIMGGTL